MVRWGISRSEAYRIVGDVFPVLQIGKQTRRVRIADVEEYEKNNLRFDRDRGEA